MRHNSVFVRPERAQDHPEVFSVHLRAFGRPDEAQLVERLRHQGEQPQVSLVAQHNGQLVGHILFTPVRLPQSPRVRAMGLAPLAVRPEFQRRGVGSRLVQVGLDALRIAAVDLVFVVGDSRYYARFGFGAANVHGLHYPDPALDPHLMVAPLRAGALVGAKGLVQYAPPFEALDTAGVSVGNEAAC